MDKIDDYNRPRLFLLKDWFDEQLCEKIRSEIRLSTDLQPSILRKGISLELEEMRKTYDINISEPTQLLVQSRLLEIQPKLENCFGLKLTELQIPKYLLQKTNETEHPNNIKSSQVSIVIFLNNQTENLDEASSCRGSLTFAKFFSDDYADKYDLSVRGETGLFVAFCSELTHVFQPVTHGERYMIVSHFV
ncbi:hypothetical protein [Iningainema tapete]|uniref:Uncharacterized protein n=1 Tax=Iningainema tapete BLCC-T55 TaxID=2748662 RepID=A0A8J7CEV3_9CYAN|nr:hypothetical protein [Iningainema tapete]MBD2773970.1 hypothetical protein [Iningainema tapete BLCC-T55]